MASIRKRPDRPKPWEAVFRDPTGRQRTKSFAKKVDAQRFITTMEADKLRGSYIDPAAGKVTFKDFADRWLAAHTFNESSREATAQRLRVHIYPTFGDLELLAIKASTVQAWLRDRSQSNAPAHVRVMYVNLSSVLAAAVDDGVIAKNPCSAASVRAPKVELAPVVPWTTEQVLSVVAQHPAAWRSIPIAAAGCGLRQGEVFGLRVQDVDFLRRKIHVRKQVKKVGGRLVLEAPKGTRVREVPLPEPVAVALSTHIAATVRGPEDSIFTNTRGGLIDRSGFNQYVWKPALERAGVEPTRNNGMHALRHYYASVLLDAGESVRTVADFLGHADVGFTLAVYCHLMPESEDRTRRAVEAAWASCEPSVSQGAL